LKRPPFFRNRQHTPTVRINHRIRAREVRVIGADGQQAGIMSVSDALELAQRAGLDLVEIAASANPPVCRIVDYGKFKYQEAKKEKDSKKHQHANKVKEIQLRPGIDPHDFQTKLDHTIDFLCEDMKVKVSLRFRGREMAHTELGFNVVNRFVEHLAPFGHPDFEPKLIGRGINLMISPLPRNKRAKNPREGGADRVQQMAAETKNGEPDHDGEE
jgi:translation initiation factor IF-3